MEKNVQNKISYNPTLAGVSFTLMICAYVLISLIGQMILTALRVDVGVLYYAINSCFSVLAMLIVIKIQTKKSSLGRGLFCNFKKFSFKYGILSVVLAVGMFLGLGFINILFGNLLGAPEQTINPTNYLTNFFNYAVFLVFMAVLPAITEEMFFRGLMLDVLKNGKNLSAILIVSLSFALYHGSVYQIIYQFIYGVGLTILAIKSESIIPSLLAHFLNNFAVLTIEYLKLNVNLFSPIVIGTGFILLAVFAVFMIKDKKTINEKIVNKKVTEFFIPYGLLGIIICLILIIAGAVK
jgi:membrane protease YdiL (CAAX protease family)